VLKGVNLEVEEGKFIGVVGPNGDGKTALCLLIAGILSKSVKGECRGKIEVFGKDALRTDVGQLSEDIAVAL